MRNNLIKVPSCKPHNTELSKLDERFRYYIQATSQSPIASQEFSGAPIRSLQKPEAKAYRERMLKDLHPGLLDGQPTLAQKVSSTDLKLFFEKITRGLYYHHTSSCFRGTVSSRCTHITGPSDNFPPIIAIFSEMLPHMKDGDITHADVFKYKYAVVLEDGRHAFAILGTFYGDVTFFSIGVEDSDARSAEPG